MHLWATRKLADEIVVGAVKVRRHCRDPLAAVLATVTFNQLEAGKGIEVAVACDAASADHCTHLTEHDIELLAGSNTVATLLPGAEFSTRAQYPDARRLLSAGATVALATDCNPGSSYTTSMPFCIAVAVCSTKNGAAFFAGNF